MTGAETAQRVKMTVVPLPRRPRVAPTGSLAPELAQRPEDKITIDQGAGMQIASRIVERPDVEGLHGPLVVSRRRAKATIHHECVKTPIELQEEGETLG